MATGAVLALHPDYALHGNLKTLVNGPSLECVKSHPMDS
jgi:hypothetical protein